MIRLRTLGLLGAVAASISATAADVKPEDAIQYRQSVFNAGPARARACCAHIGINPSECFQIVLRLFSELSVRSPAS